MIINIAFIGLEASGKSQLINRLAEPQRPFSHSHNKTVDIYPTPLIKKTNNQGIQGVIYWDTSDAERYQNISGTTINDCQYLALCVDLSSDLDADAIKLRITQIREQLNNKDIPIYLVGTKCDLTRKVTDQQMQALQQELQLAKIFTVSSLNDQGVAELKAELDALAPIKITSPIYRVIPLLVRGSALRDQLFALNQALNYIPKNKALRIGQCAERLIHSLIKTQDVLVRQQAIAAFEKESTQIIGNAYPKIAALITGVVVTALVIVIAAAIGFGIGFAAGIWTGPGAFISGFLAGATAASVVIGISSILGGGLGMFSAMEAYKVEKKRDNSKLSVKDCIQDIAELELENFDSMIAKP